MSEKNIDDSSSLELLQLVIFQINEEEFGIETTKVKEIIRIPDITKLPLAQEHIEGIINLRGEIVPVINFSKLLRMEKIDLKNSEEKERVIVLEIGNMVAGIIVDSVSEVTQISLSDIDSTPEMISSKVRDDHIKGVGKINDRLLILLKIEEIVSESYVPNSSDLNNERCVTV